ncbi:MAG: alpha/beta hydrolase, partial [Gammaproteobacteria bacterium]
AQFIEFLARYTVATRINLLAYSSGCRTVGGALNLLGKRIQDPSILRLGHVYLAQSDQPISEFFSELPLYFDLLEAMTVTAARGDRVLRLAGMTDGQTRLGAISERSGARLDLSPDIAARVAKILNSERMVIIDLSDVPAVEYRLTHDAWYDSPWVSTDVMLTLLGNLNVRQRALEPVKVTGATVWRFPPDYIERLNANISQWRREQEQNSRTEQAEDSL